MISYEDIMKIKNGLDNAETDEPFLYQEDDEVKVVGNANNTKLRKHTYKLTFETESGDRTTKVYKDVFVTPRKRLNVVRLLVRMLPYFRKPRPDGSVSDYSDIEIAELFLGMEDAVYDMIYGLAVEVLGVPEELKDYIDPVSALVFALQLINDNPAVVREAEMSFE